MQHAIMANLAPEVPTANLAPGAALLANIWLLRLCQQIIVGKYLAPAAPLENMWLRRQIWLLR
jgi:hypothetical protein